jgi:hypothetical protein
LPLPEKAVTAPPPVTLASVYSSIPQEPAGPPKGYFSPRWLGHGLTALLIALTVMMVVEVWSGLQQAELLDRIQQHGPFTHEEAQANDARQGIIVTLRLVALCFTGIVFCCWVYVVAENVRALGARRLKYSPGWAVGYYFIPIVCLWVPYQAMKEIWKASVDPGNWRSIRTSPIVSWWWGLWLFAIAFNYLLVRITIMAGGHDPVLATRMDIASCFVGIPRNVVAILLVQMLSAIQVRTATEPR